MYSIKANPSVSEYYQNLSTHEGDSGIDVFFAEDQIIEGGSLASTIKLGIRCSLDLNGPSSYMLMPRSSISKTPLRMSNSFGLIDSGYRGELMIKVDNLAETFIIKKGTSLFQLVAPHFQQCRIQLVSELSETDRGEGCFGSTGNN